MKNKRILMSWVALLTWMSIIFIMSNQPGEISSKHSDLVIKIFTIVGIDLNSSFGELTSFLVRKIAHFSEYFIMYLLTYNLFKYYFGKRSVFILSFIFVVGYAISDEIHQYFVPGRQMALMDVLIDSMGALMGLFITKIVDNKKVIVFKFKRFYINNIMY